MTIGTQPNNSILYRTMVVAGKFNTKDILKSNSERYVFLNPTFENEKDLSHFFKQRKATVIIGEVTDFRIFNYGRNSSSNIKIPTQDYSY